MPATPNREAPTYFLSVQPDGASESQRIDVSDRVLTLSYEDAESEADKLALTIDNFDLSNLDDPLFAKGNMLKVSWGYPGNMSPTRDAVIQEVKGFRTLTVNALDRSILAHKEQENRIWHNMTRSAVAEQIAAELGYLKQFVHVDDTTRIHEAIAQVRETNAQFMRRLAMREGHQFYVDFDGIHWHARKTGQAPAREYVYYLDENRGDIIDVVIDNDITAKPAQIVMRGKDPVTKEEFTVEGSNAETKRTGLAPLVDAGAPGEIVIVGDKRTGSARLGMKVVHASTESSEASAKSHADGAYKGAALTNVELTVQAVGDPQQLAKTVITISGLRSLSGKYYTSKITHKLGANGYVMEMKCKREGRSQGEGAPSEAKQNEKATADPNALTPSIVIVGDKRTGEAKLQWKQGRGRDSDGKGEG